VKVVTVIVFIVLGCLMIFGVLRGGTPAGLRTAFANLTVGDAPFAGGVSAMIGVAMIAGFSFQGTELIGVAAGETADPARNIPRAMRQVFWRILLFYVLAIAVIGLLIPYTDPNLLKSDVESIGVSPFALVFRNAGLAFAAGVMNAVVLTAVLSAGNSGMYASTRMLYNLAREGRAPRCFARLSRNGVPLIALLATTAIGAMCFLTTIFKSQTTYLWLLNLSGMTGFIVWLGIAVSHYRFRKGFIAQGHDLAELPYRSGFFPWGPIFAFVLCMVITLGQNYQAFLGGRIDWRGVAATYLGIPMFLAMWLGYRWRHGSRLVRYADMRFGAKAAEATTQVPTN
jgi:lysine-specific permease